MGKTKKKNILIWVLFAAYSAVTLICALRHEVWLDEAQAWVIVRDTPLAKLSDVLNAEGHPPLWYLILYPFVRLGFPTDKVSVISWFFAAVGAAVLLFKVRLPLPLKAAMLVSAGSLYFNSVMLRSYCLVPPLLFAILWIFPERRRHAALYGLLIALLANTHVFVCGIWGVLGLYMLYELFSEWRNADIKENIAKLAGLAIAGTGVLTLIIPLLGSVRRNAIAGKRVAFFDSIITNLLDCPNNIFENYFNLTGGYNPIWIPVFSFMTAACAVMLILLRHYRRAFLVQLGFVFFYVISSGILWVSLPARSAIFVLSFGLSLGLAQFEDGKFRDFKVSGQIGGMLGRLLESLKKADLNAQKVYTVILTVCLSVSAPIGIKILYEDITGNFSTSKQTAEYIKNNFEKDAVFITFFSGTPEISFYYPDFIQYSVRSREFISYMNYGRIVCEDDADEVVEMLSQFDNLYIINYDQYNDTRKQIGIRKNEIFVSDDGVKYDYPKTFFVIENYDPNAVRECIIDLKETYDEQ